MNIDRQSSWVCVYVCECICVLVICYRNHTYHVCLIFFSSPGHKMTSLHKCTSNTNLVFINFFVHLLILNVQHKYFEQKTRLISCSYVTKSTISWLKLFINLRSNKRYVTWKQLSRTELFVWLNDEDTYTIKKHNLHFLDDITS